LRHVGCRSRRPDRMQQMRAGGRRTSREFRGVRLWQFTQFLRSIDRDSGPNSRWCARGCPSPSRGTSDHDNCRTAACCSRVSVPAVARLQRGQIRLVVAVEAVVVPAMEPCPMMTSECSWGTINCCFARSAAWRLVFLVARVAVESDRSSLRESGRRRTADGGVSRKAGSTSGIAPTGRPGPESSRNAVARPVKTITSRTTRGKFFARQSFPMCGRHAGSLNRFAGPEVLLGRRRSCSCCPGRHRLGYRAGHLVAGGKAGHSIFETADLRDGRLISSSDSPSIAFIRTRLRVFTPSLTA